MKESLRKLVSKQGGEVGITLFEGYPTVYYPISEEARIRKYVTRYLPDLQIEYRARYTAIAVY